jgi:hypothetical protein
MKVLNNYIHHNGQIGMSGLGDGSPCAHTSFSVVRPQGRLAGPRRCQEFDT